MSARNYRNNAPSATLVSGASSADNTFTISDSTGFPTAPFTVAIERGTLGEEIVLVTSVVGNTFTVTRGYDGTAALDHAATSRVEHVAAAIDYREANTHIQTANGVHGATGDVVGTEGVQTLAGKTLVDPKINGAAENYAVVIAASASGDLIDAQTSGTSQFRVTRTGVVSFGQLNVTSDIVVPAGTTTGMTANKNGQVAIKGGATGPELTISPPNATAGTAAIKVGTGFQVNRDGKVIAASADLAGNLTVGGSSTTNGDSVVKGKASVTGTLSVSGDSTLSKLQVAGDINANGRVDAGTDLTAAGNASIAGSLGVGSLTTGPLSATSISSPGIPRVLAARPGVSGVVAPNSGADVAGSAAITFQADHVYEVTGLFEYNIANAVYGDMALSVRLDATTIGVGWRKRFTDQGTNDGHAEAVPFSVIFTGQSGAHEVRIGFNGSTYGGNTSVRCWWFKVVDLGKAAEVGW